MTAAFRSALLPIALLAALGAAVWLTGLRVVVIQPIGALPDGVTAIVIGLPGLRLIDSPDAVCFRKSGGVSLLCRGMTAAAIASNGTILARLPYSEILYTLSGAPDVMR